EIGFLRHTIENTVAVLDCAANRHERSRGLELLQKRVIGHAEHADARVGLDAELEQPRLPAITLFALLIGFLHGCPSGVPPVARAGSVQSHIATWCAEWTGRWHAGSARADG